MGYQELADLVLFLHAVFVLFVIAGLAFTIVGGYRGWVWSRKLWFRLSHLGCISFVVLQTWMGFVCPLTRLEDWLRVRAAGESYDQTFIQHWFQRLLYYNAPDWVFATGYTVFALLVIVFWVIYPPHIDRWRRKLDPVPSRSGDR